MVKVFKDLSELHNAAIDEGNPNLFDSVLDAVIWRARREHEEEKADARSKETPADRLIPYKTVSEILEEADDDFEWIVPGFLARGNTTEVSGMSKLSGKTTLLLDMVSAVLEGLPWLGKTTVQSKVMFLSEQGNNLREAFKIAGFDESTEGLYIVQKSTVRDRDWPDVARTVSKVCDDLEVDVLVVDTIAQFGEINDENTVADVRAALRELHRAAQDHNLAVIHTRHFGKKGKPRGSTQFDADVDFLFTLTRPEGGPQDTSARVLHGEGRSREIFKRLHIDLRDGGYVLLAEGVSDDRIKFKAAIAAVIEVLPDEPEKALSVKEICEAVGDEHNKNTLRQRVIPWMVEKEQVTKTHEGSPKNPARYYRPNDEKPLRYNPDPQGSELYHNGDPQGLGGENPQGYDDLGRHDEHGGGHPGGRDARPGVRLVTDEEGLSEVVTRIEDATLVGADTEDTGLEVGRDRVRTIQVATEDGFSAMVDA